MDLVEKLKIEQTRRGATDAEFAELLGITRQMWIMIKQRQANPGLAVLQGVLRAYPEMKKEVLAYIRDRDKNGGTIALDAQG